MPEYDKESVLWIYVIYPRKGTECNTHIEKSPSQTPAEWQDNTQIFDA